MNLVKKCIKEKINLKDVAELKELINKYENLYPRDLDINIMRSQFYLLNNDFDNALNWAKKGVERNPYNAEVNYNLAIIYEIQKNYKVAGEIAEKEGNIDILQNDIPLLVNNMIEALQEQIKILENTELKNQYINDLKWISKNFGERFGLYDSTFWGKKDIIGQIYEDQNHNKRFVAYYDSAKVYLLEKNIEKNAVCEKVEMRKATFTQDIVVNEETDVLLPIATPEENFYQFRTDDKEYIIEQDICNHFNYYRIPKNASVRSAKPAYFGKPILLKQDKNKKKLVLNIFIDGLSQYLLNQHGLEKLMPHTYKFFKKGVICTKAFSGSEWTYPSMATFMTGLDTTHHMIVGNQLLVNLPKNCTLVAEYFQREGYTTAKLDGNWRVTPVFGYARGMDRIVYQHQNAGMKINEVITNVLEQLLFMKETNQFVYMGINDLHDIADEMDLSESIQAQLPIQNRVIEKQDVSSVKEKYDSNKIQSYMKVISKIDLYLNILYQYIEENYKEDEIIVSLFSDHGQGFLIKEEEPFLSIKRSNVAFMFRGGNNIYSEHICDELMSACDYLPIICKLADIPLDDWKIDGRLPKFFGGDEEREYVITESIHPNDPYYASMPMKEKIFYIKSENKAHIDGRYNIGNYIGECYDWAENRIHVSDDELQKYLDVIINHISGNLIYE